MTDNRHQRPHDAEENRDPQGPEVAAAESSRKEEARHTRRRLFKAGLAAVPVVLTLKSRTAWGQVVPDPTPSGTVSKLPNYGAAGDWVGPPGGPYQWVGFIDPNTGDWNGLGYEPPDPYGSGKPEDKYP